jgi:hypothetical protein
LYKTSGGGGTGKDWQPTRVWHPKGEAGKKKYIHLLERDEECLELLVRSANDGRGIVPNRVVGSLPLRLKASRPDPWENPTVLSLAIYHLEVSAYCFLGVFEK